MPFSWRPGFESSLCLLIIWILKTIFYARNTCEKRNKFCIYLDRVFRTISAGLDFSLYAIHRTFDARPFAAIG